MGFEELPKGWDEFFSGGGEKLPEGLAPDPAPAALAPAEPPATPPAIIDPPPTPPAVDPALQRLLDDASTREAELRTQYANNEAALTAQLKALQDKVEKLTTAPAPDAATDPIGHVLHKINELATKVDSVVGRQSQTLEQTDQQTKFQAFAKSIDDNVAAFKKDHADYDDAYNFVRASREKQLMMVGYSKAEANQKIGQEEMEIVQKSFQNRKNPAEAAYALAQSLGYAKKADPTPPENKLETIKKGLEAAGGIERAGKPAGGPPELSTMNNDELNDFVQNKWDQSFGTGKNIF